MQDAGMTDDDYARLGKQTLRVFARKERAAEVARRADTARKVRIGAAVVNAIEHGNAKLLEMVVVLCNGLYTKPKDRELLGLPKDSSALGSVDSWGSGYFASLGEVCGRAVQERAARNQTNGVTKGTGESRSAAREPNGASGSGPRSAEVSPPSGAARA